jgi:hypothetical protein
VAHHLGGQTVAKNVSSDTSRALQPSTHESLPHDVTDRGWPAQTDPRCDTPQENLPALTRSTTRFEIERQGRSDVLEQWKPVVNPTLSTNDKLPSTPRDVVELESDDFSPAQTQSSEQE